jgi:beta-glucosidase
MRKKKESVKLFLIAAVTLVQLIACTRLEPYKNANLPFEERAKDLVSRMTLNEKISQMMDVAPAISRLNVPEYNWWNEGLHGVARTGVATVFPQAIGMAATFNDSLIFNVADVISTEFRAKYNDYIKKGEHDRYKGLTVWSPNINIFRDPRWGRGQETYGEDPFLTSRLGVAFVKGLQGNDPRYLKVVSTPKHFAVHSGPESDRHHFDARIDERDFMDTYSPAFEACIREAKAYSIMGAYNRYMGKACNASDFLLKQTLRDKWGFKGYVVSDCGAITDIYMNHKLVKTPAEAAALAVKSGCDLECGDTYSYLKEAVQKGFITEKEIDASVTRLFVARMKLGLFDPEEKVAYNKIPLSANDAPEHRALALKVAQQSIVLLKNEKNILPLSKGIRSIAVFGPNADNVDVLYGNYNGISSKPVTPLQALKNKLGDKVKISYLKICDLADDNPLLKVISGENLMSDGNKGLKAEYFGNTKLEGNPVVTRYDSKIDFTWDGTSPDPKLKSVDFSARWTGYLTAPQTDNYYLNFTGDDGFRLYLDDQLLLESWQEQGTTSIIKQVKLEKDRKYKVKIEYYQSKGGAIARFEWGVKVGDPLLEAKKLAAQSDAVVFFGGLSPSLEGEEMSVTIDGFKGGDRTKIDLPAIQEKCLKALNETSKPVIFVLMSGSAVATNYASSSIPAILQAWYPGEEGGTAIADVLFGDYNPAGRLPVTFYKSVDQLPAFTDYNMKGRTYRYFEGEPLYPFGYGLSYTTFAYSNLSVPKVIKAGETVNVTVDVQNTGSSDGDEVVQLYLSLASSDIPVPHFAMKGFKRIHLNKGQKQTVTFALTPKQLSLVDKNLQRTELPLKVTFYAGGMAPVFNKANEKLVTATLSINGSPFKIQD